MKLRKGNLLVTPDKCDLAVGLPGPAQRQPCELVTLFRKIIKSGKIVKGENKDEKGDKQGTKEDRSNTHPPYCSARIYFNYRKCVAGVF
jgi:hypothetical protein